MFNIIAVRNYYPLKTKVVPMKQEKYDFSSSSSLKGSQIFAIAVRALHLVLYISQGSLMLINILESNLNGS